MNCATVKQIDFARDRIVLIKADMRGEGREMNELLKAYELIKQYMDRLDIGIQTAWIYLEDAYRKTQEGEEK